MESIGNHKITSLAFTASVSDPAYGLTDDGQVFLGHGPEEFEERRWTHLGRLGGAVILGSPMQVRVGERLSTTAVVIATQRLPVTISV